MSTTPVELTPENLTVEHIKSWTRPGEMRRHMAGPLREKIIELIAQVQQPQPEVIVPPVPSPEEQAVEQQRLADEAEVARKAAEEAAKPKKIVLDYQVKDENGNPLGRPTHLEAFSHEEMQGKIIEAHQQAVRFAYRLKNQKVQSQKEISNPPAQPVVDATTDEQILQALKDIKSDDPKKQVEAQRKLIADEVARQQKIKDAEQAELTRQANVSHKFLELHKHDFNNCAANRELLKEYFEEHQLGWTLDNLEIALLALDSRLAPVVVSEAPAVPANPAPPVPPVSTTPAAGPVVQPVPTATVVVPPPANPAPAAPRPGVNGGIVPGENSGSRPPIQPQPTELTAEEVRSWSGQEMLRKMKDPIMGPKIKAFLAARNAAKQRA